eukprot:gene10086-11116_t
MCSGSLPLLYLLSFSIGSSVGFQPLSELNALTSDFSDLDVSCFGKSKTFMLQLDDAVKEGKKCDAQATLLLGRIETMCQYLKPLNGFASKFDRLLKLLKTFQKSLDKLTKFADNIPKIGQLRKIIVEKVIPMSLDVMEKISKQVNKVIDFEKVVLGFKKTAKLLWKIDKRGAKVCKLTSPVGLSLEQLQRMVRGFNNGSMNVLEKTDKAQKCMTQYCHGRGGGSSCSECRLVEKGSTDSSPKILSWKGKMTTCHQKLSQANSLLSKMNFISTLVRISEQLFTSIENFIEPINRKLSSLASSVGKVLSNLMSCCPCGRPNLIGCGIKAATATINLMTCPLDGVTNYVVSQFMTVIKQKILAFLGITIPKIGIEFEIPSMGFTIPLPSFLQACIGVSKTEMKITTAKSFQLRIASSFTGEKYSVVKKSSLGGEIKAACSDALNGFKKIGKSMSTCFDRVDDLFFAIPVIGFLAALTCDPNYKDPDPGINYCPCQSGEDALVNKNEKQPNCVVWHRTWIKSCATTCRDKKYVSGKDPSGKTSLMSTTNGYPHCDKLKYYCRKENVVVKNGKVKCANAYTHLTGSCPIIPDPGYICPIASIHCGSVSHGKAVCWDYRFIECTKDNGKRFPMCNCRNRDSGGFEKGEIVCQIESKSSSDNLQALKEIRHSVSCFRPLGRYENVKTDCGSNMVPCVVEKPAIDAYERCSLSKGEKFWDAHGKKFVYAGATVLVFGVAVLLGYIVVVIRGGEGFNCKACLIAALIPGIIIAIGISLIVCGSVIKTPEDNISNYVRMG